MADGVDVDGELRERLAKKVYETGAYCGVCGYEGWESCADCRDCCLRYVAAVLDALGVEQVGWHAKDPERYCPLNGDLWAVVRDKAEYVPVYRLASPSLTPSPEADVRSEQSGRTGGEL